MRRSLRSLIVLGAAIVPLTLFVGLLLIRSAADSQEAAAQQGVGIDCPEAASCVAGAFFTTVGDQNCDGDVDAADVDLIVSGLYCDPCGECDGDDANQDGRVSAADVLAVIQRLAAPVPTPRPTVTPARTVTAAPTATSIVAGAPAAVDDGAATLVGEPVNIFVLANDSDPNADPLTVTNFTQPANGSVTFTNNVATYTPGGGFSGTNSFTYMISDGTGRTGSATVTVVVNLLPPDPATVAPPPANGVVTILSDATRFLYTGPDAVQFGMPPGTIDPIRAAVVRGKVKSRDGTPLPGVRITILNHGEFGFTASRTDGMFDMVVNGGGPLAISYEKMGFLTAQRPVDVPWQDYVVLPDVVLIPLDPQVTGVDLASGQMQVARGSVMSDADGSRQATLLFPPGTMATMELPNGQTQSLTRLSVRATEYTVGPSGPEAMPGELPPSSAYTYAVELTVDEATAAGAKQVSFSPPILQYLENFLDIPTGTSVPLGFYDREQAVWIPSPNGQVIEILGVVAGRAQLDSDGDGVVDNGAALGVSDEERQHLASLYAAGQSLWRVPLPHFSTPDLNFPARPPDDATAPNSPGAETEEAIDQCLAEAAGSIIECQNQTLGETLPVAGTPFTLNYRSDRVPGRVSARQVTLPVSSAAVPGSLKRIETEVNVAGQALRQTLSSAPSQRVTFTWDGRDVYGRAVQGGQPFAARIGFVYDAVYTQPSAERSFGNYGGAEFSLNTARDEITIEQPLAGEVGTFDARGHGLGGWSLSPHHAYAPESQVLYLGDGRRISTGPIPFIITTVSGNGAIDSEDAPQGIPAKDVGGLDRPQAIEVGPDGSIYFTEDDGVRRVDPDGNLTTIAGIKGQSGFGGDGGPATQALLDGPLGLAFGADGSLYIADSENIRVRRVAPDGTISTVAGNGVSGRGGDGGPATQAQFVFPQGVAVGPDGSLYIADTSTNTDELGGLVRRVGPDGIIRTFAGGGGSCCEEDPDGDLASQTYFEDPFDIAVDRQGVVYLLDSSFCAVFRIAPDGMVTRVAGHFNVSDFGGDGGPAPLAGLSFPKGIALGADGSIYIADENNSRIRRVGPGGFITTIAGGGDDRKTDNVPATQAALDEPTGVAVSPDATLYVVDNGSSLVSRLHPPLPESFTTSISVASPDGNSLYQFDGSGRHLRTVDTLTNAIIYTFTYDDAGRLLEVRDVVGNVTTIERDSAGNPTTIVGPFGHRSTLALDANGFLASMTTPANETAGMTYTSDGLLTDFTSPRGPSSHYQYDPLGRLTRADDLAGGFKILSRSEFSSGHQVTMTSGLGRTTAYRSEQLPTGDQRLINTAPDGTESRSDLLQDGTSIGILPDGTTTSTTLAPDSRFGMQAAVTASTTITPPSGAALVVNNSRAAVLADPTDLLSLTSLTETATNGIRSSTNAYMAANRTILTTTAEGRTRSLTIDAVGRPETSQFANLHPTTLVYDARGRLASASSGSGAELRALSFSYGSDGLLETLTDPLDRVVTVSRDANGRVVRKRLADGDEIAYGFDAAGDLTSVTPPGRPTYAFEYDARGDLARVIPPSVPGSGPTTYSRNLDGNLTSIDRPGAESVIFAYDAAGRPNAVTLSNLGGTASLYSLAYDTTSGLIASVTGPGSQTLSHAYDGFLVRGTTWNGPVAGSVTRSFDADFRTATESVNGSATVTFAYDDDDLLIAAGALAISRDVTTGFPTTTTIGMVSDAVTYDGFGGTARHEVSAGGTGLYDVSYGRNAAGRITNKVETIGGVTSTFDYVYDLKGQLTQVDRDGTVVESYVYDGNGNRTSATVGGVSVAATYDVQDRLVTHDVATFQYSPSGRLVARTVGEATTGYDYDALGNLLGVTLPDSTRVTYLLDAVDRRIGRSVNGTAAGRFLYSGAEPVAELDAAGNLVSRFVYAGARVPAYLVKGGIPYRIVTDEVGSVRLVIDAQTGAISQRIDYDSFGNVLLDTNPGFQPFGFAGGLYDPATGLVHFGMREYEAATGRWMSGDPIWFAGGESNLYRYSRNDPVNLVDPTGLDTNDFIGGVVAGVVDAFAFNPALTFARATGALGNLISEALGMPTTPLPEDNLVDATLDLAQSFSEEPLIDDPLDFEAGRSCGHLLTAVVGGIRNLVGKIGRGALSAGEEAELAALRARNAQRLAEGRAKQVDFGKLADSAADARNASNAQSLAKRTTNNAAQEPKVEVVKAEGGAGNVGNGRYRAR